MIKTEHQIEGDVRNFLKTTALATAIGGKIYRSTQRPKDSTDEDLVVVYTTSNAAQFQRGVITLNIYVKDIYPKGVPTEDGERCEALESVAATVFKKAVSVKGYRLALRSAPQSVRDESIHCSIVSVSLDFKHYE